MIVYSSDSNDSSFTRNQVQNPTSLLGDLDGHSNRFWLGSRGLSYCPPHPTSLSWWSNVVGVATNISLGIRQ